jgi:hypothetical protein
MSTSSKWIWRVAGLLWAGPLLGLALDALSSRPTFVSNPDAFPPQPIEGRIRDALVYVVASVPGLIVIWRTWRPK